MLSAPVTMSPINLRGNIPTKSEVVRQKMTAINAVVSDSV